MLAGGIASFFKAKLTWCGRAAASESDPEGTLIVMNMWAN
jgi:hypothetical protein